MASHRAHSRAVGSRPSPGTLKRSESRRTSRPLPAWYAVDLRFVERFPEVVPLERLKTTPGLEEMMVTKKGARLSVQPVAREEFEIVRQLGRRRRQLLISPPG